MAISAKIVVVAAIGAVTFDAMGVLLAGEACAQQTQAAATPADRCEGTLCDLYYGTKGNGADAAGPNTANPKPAVGSATSGVPAGATPVMAPSGNFLGRWFGGGSADSARTPPPPSEPASAGNSYMHMGTGGILGGRSERCSGTMCDLFYGSSPAEPATLGQQQASVTSSANAAPVVHRHILHESETRPKCSSPAADPWHCLR